MKLWHVRRRRVVRTYGASDSAVHATDVAPTSGTILSADDAGVIRLWRGIPNADRRAARN